MRARLQTLSELNRAIRNNDVATVTQQLAAGEPGLLALEFAPGVSRWEWAATDPRWRNPFGYLRGGCLTTFADTLMSSAIGSVLEKDELATTAEIKVSFLHAAPVGLIRGEARVIHKGRRVAFLEAEISSQEAQLLATASSTWTVLRANS